MGVGKINLKIEGVAIDVTINAVYSLCAIYGIGVSMSKKILTACAVDHNSKIMNLSQEQVDAIVQYIRNSGAVTTEGELRRQVQLNIKRKIAIGCYQGLRHKVGLPVRGQRTKTNARTRKGKRKSSGSGIKKNKK